MQPFVVAGEDRHWPAFLSRWSLVAWVVALSLMDLRMPGLGGIEATRRILEGSQDTGVLVVTLVEDDDAVFAAMRAGARGYLPKGADKEEMLLAIRAVARGEAVFGPGIARRLKTVRNYVSNIFTKLQVADRAQAIIRVREAGLGREVE